MIEENPTALGRGISYEFVSPLSIRHQRCRSQQHAVEIHAVQDGFLDPVSPRTRA